MLEYNLSPEVAARHKKAAVSNVAGLAVSGLHPPE
ncbi:hypothetical protein [Streptomyces sp. SID1121]